MGSTWYCDHHWDELYENCIAHVNLDLLGSKGADHTLAIRTAGLEGTKWLKEHEGMYDGVIFSMRFRSDGLAAVRISLSGEQRSLIISIQDMKQEKKENSQMHLDLVCTGGIQRKIPLTRSILMV